MSGGQVGTSSQDRRRREGCEVADRRQALVLIDLQVDYFADDELARTARRRSGGNSTTRR
jgi:hypothetical protein